MGSWAFTLLPHCAGWTRPPLFLLRRSSSVVSLAALASQPAGSLAGLSPFPEAGPALSVLSQFLPALVSSGPPSVIESSVSFLKTFPRLSFILLLLLNFSEKRMIVTAPISV